jgi:hypothetical protein
MNRLTRRLPVFLLLVVAGNAAGQEAPPKAADRPEVKFPALLAAKPLPEDSKDDKLRKLLKARYNAVLTEARFNYEQERSAFAPDRRDDPDHRYGMWQRLVRSGLELCDKPAEKVAIWKNYLELTREAEEIEKARYEAKRSEIDSYERARYERLNAEIQLLRADREAGTAKDK